MWRKSSYCPTDGCVEVAFEATNEVRVRDSKNKTDPVLVFTDDEWKAFTEGVKAGQFDR